MNTEWCALKRPIIRFGYGGHSDRGIVETERLGPGDAETLESKFTGADYDVRLLAIESDGQTASIEITRKGGGRPADENETRTVRLINRKKRETYADALKDHKDATAAYAGLKSNQSPDSGSPHRVVALPFKGNGDYVVVAYAEISTPGTVGKLLGNAPKAKLYVSEGALQEPLDYGSMGAGGGGP